MNQHRVNNWRNLRHARMLETGIGADVHFLVGRSGEEKQLISAHKYMLSAVSEVFEGQFLRFNALSGTQEGTDEEKPIEVNDVGAGAFRAMLAYIYALDFSGVIKQNVLEVYYAGKKYMIGALVNQCRHWLLNAHNLGVDNVLPVLKFVQLHEDWSLIERCWGFVDKNAKAVMDSEDFSLLDEADLRKIFSRNIPGIYWLRAHLLETGKRADIHFLVGNTWLNEDKKLISGHKFILFAVSEVFERQIVEGHFGRLPRDQRGTKNAPVEVPDIHPNVFWAMLCYIYAQDFSGVNKQNVFDVYSAGKKYAIIGLVNVCRQLLLNGWFLDADNVFSMLSHACVHEDQALINHCWRFIDINIKVVLNSEEFFMLNQENLCELFSRDTLEADELFLFQSLHNWAIRSCKENGLWLNARNKRELIGQAIYQIRFPLLTEQEFTKHIVPIDLLTKDDVIAMYIHYNKHSAAIPQYRNHFNSQPRSFSLRKNIAFPLPKKQSSSYMPPLHTSRNVLPKKQSSHQRRGLNHH